MAKYYHQSWRQQNIDSRYPFSDEAPLLSNDGQDFGVGTLLDAIVYPIGGGPRMYISRVHVETFEVTIHIGTAASPELCSGSFDPLDPPSSVRLRDAHGRAAGLLISEPIRLSIFQGWGVGDHLFSPAATELAASVCVPTPEVGVRGIITEEGEILTGDIWIVGENGVIVRRDTSDGLGDGHSVVRVDIVGEPLFVQALCGEVTVGEEAEPAFEAIPFLQTINEVPPDEHGNFNITAGTHDAAKPILRFVPTREGLVVEAVGQETGEVP